MIDGQTESKSYIQKKSVLELILFFLVQWRPMMLPDRQINHGSQTEQVEEAGLSSRHIAATVLSVMGENKDSLHLLKLQVIQELLLPLEGYRLFLLLCKQPWDRLSKHVPSQEIKPCNLQVMYTEMFNIQSLQ